MGVLPAIQSYKTILNWKNKLILNQIGLDSDQILTFPKIHNSGNTQKYIQLSTILKYNI